MRILITNDDGINAPGLKVMEAIAAEIAGPEGEVWTVAPAFEKSGVAHCISYVHPTLISELAPRRFAVEGFPADCVLAGLYDVLADTPPDLILSGVNRGNNAGQNVLYSGTLGAAMEGALQGRRAIALSQYFGPANAGLDNPFEAAAAHGADVVRKLIAADQWDSGGYHTFYNVNFPPIPAVEVRGARVASQGTHDRPNHGMKPVTAPNGRRFLWVEGRRQDLPTAPGTDVAACLDGYIAVTPLRADLTAHDRLATLADALA
ncbi:5'/3'-nucleotidase SurE [Rhodobacterales bacterium HKCCE2091]|nr:5'/3'-nucleotidase SurE [Rhodobacterales bacterium HKCCE2091]